MRILAIGDIHGKTVWQQLVTSMPADVIVFMGDFIILSRWLSNRQFIANLEEILHFKRNNFQRVHLLIGNHDLPFIYSGINLRKLISPVMSTLYRNNEDCFEIAIQYDTFLFSHAGISKGWYEKHKLKISSSQGNTLAEKLSALHRSDDYKILHDRGKARGGPFDCGGITYADKIETENCGLPGFVQIVGHTKVPQPVKHDFDNGAVIYIDCLNSVDSCLYINGMDVRVIDNAGRMSPLKVVKAETRLRYCCGSI